MDPTQFAGVFYPFLASIPRVAAIFVVMPLFGAKTVRGLVRNEFILVLAVFVYPLVAATAPDQVPIGLNFFYVTAKEAVVGETFAAFATSTIRTRLFRMATPRIGWVTPHLWR